MQRNNQYTCSNLINECLNSKGKDNLILPGTKGYTITTIKGPQNFIFVNAHFPLKNAVILEDFYNLINIAIDKLNPSNHNVFVFGDVNSRSYEYQKEVKTCTNESDKGINYCIAKSNLESLPFEQTFNFASVKSPNITNPLITELTEEDFIKKKSKSNV